MACQQNFFQIRYRAIRLDAEMNFVHARARARMRAFLNDSLIKLKNRGALMRLILNYCIILSDNRSESETIRQERGSFSNSAMSRADKVALIISCLFLPSSSLPSSFIPHHLFIYRRSTRSEVRSILPRRAATDLESPR